MNLPNIAVIGKMGAGKSTVGRLLTDHYGYRSLAFAGTHHGGVRDVAVRLWGTEAQNDREKLVLLGEAVRAHDPLTWVRNAVAQLNEQNRLPGDHDPEQPDVYLDHPVVVDDMRFREEAWELKGRDFLVVRVVAPRNLRIKRLQASGKWQGEDQLDDPTETQLDDWPADYTIHNDTTKRECFNQITTILERENA